MLGSLAGRLRTEAWLPLAALVLVCACSNGLELSVDLRTDYRPGLEVDGIEVVLEDGQGARLATESVVAGAGRDFVRGERLVDLAGLSPGSRRVVVTLTRGGRPVASRETRLELRGDTAVTVVITRDCASAACPPAGAPGLTACVDGRCVDPACRPGRPDACPPPACATAEDCPTPAVACLRAECAARACFEVADDSRCAAGDRCDPASGCGVAPPSDAGTDDAGADAGAIDVDAGPCTASEVLCADGLDRDCDLATDCADSDCAGQPCDDGDPCTYEDRCTGGACVGTPITCPDDDCVTRACNGTASCDESPRADGTACTDDGSPCTEDTCSGGRCDHVPRGGACPDDGNPCTDDVCASGACTHPSRPDGTDLGGWARCCGGAPVDVSTDRSNCGACGLACSGSYACTVYGGHPTCDCATANTECHGGVGFLCSTSYGVCACLNDGACPGAATCVARAGGPDYCEY